MQVCWNKIKYRIKTYRFISTIVPHLIVWYPCEKMVSIQIGVQIVLLLLCAGEILCLSLKHGNNWSMFIFLSSLIGYAQKNWMLLIIKAEYWLVKQFILWTACIIYHLWKAIVNILHWFSASHLGIPMLFADIGIAVILVLTRKAILWREAERIRISVQDNYKSVQKNFYWWLNFNSIRVFGISLRTRCYSPLKTLLLLMYLVQG